MEQKSSKEKPIISVPGTSSALSDQTKYHMGFEKVTIPFCRSSNINSSKATDVPFPRSGHRLLANDRCAIAVGGFNPALWDENNTPDTCYPILKEVWVFNLVTLRWKKLTTSGLMPKELASHAALLHDNYVLVYGGTGVPFGHSSTNRLHLLNMKTGKWRLQPTSPAAGLLTMMPPEQYGHAFVRNGEKLYVIGGTSGFQYNMQVFQLTLRPPSGGEWSSMLRGPEPLQRYRHEAFYFAGKINVLGGGTATTVCPMTHVDVFDIATGIWSEKPIQQDANHGCPVPRRCHGLAVYESTSSSGTLSVYVSGGYDGTTAFDDAWELKVSGAGAEVMYAWRKLPYNLPKPLYFHGMAVTPGGSLLIFGGVATTGQQGQEERTSELYRCWLSPPSLMEQALVKVLEQIGPADEKRLLQVARNLGLPETCVDWINNGW